MQLNGPLTDLAASNKQLSEARLVDPGLMMLSTERYGPPSDHVAAALITAPTALLVAHLALRDAITEAQDVLMEFCANGVIDERHGRRIPAESRTISSNSEFRSSSPLYNRPAAVANLSANKSDTIYAAAGYQVGVGASAGGSPLGLMPARQPLRPSIHPYKAY